MEEKDVLEIFHQNHALLTGHFKLSSGLHSQHYMQCALVLQHPGIAEKLAKEIAKKFAKKEIDFVIGPALGGITLAYEVAKALKVRGLFTERQEGTMVLRRGFSISKDERALVVEDVITTGGSTKEVVELVRNAGGIVVGVASIIDRSESPVNFGTPFTSLARIKIETYKEADCPFCKLKLPITKPGSRPAPKN